MSALLVGLGAALGAPLRYVAAHLFDGRWPVGTMTVNILGSGLFGLFAAMSLGEHAWAFVAIGFCGALTSFSSFAVQTVERSPRISAAYAVSTTLLCIGACALGWTLGSAVA